MVPTQRFYLGLVLTTCTVVFVHFSNVVATSEPITTNSPASQGQECISGPSGWYRGTVNHTYTGIPCQRWDSNTPHIPKQHPEDGGHHNYCRNPDRDLNGTWCYTTNDTVRWQFCNIPKCNDDSVLVWTNYDSAQENSHILSLKADPEIVKKLTDKSGILNVSVLVGSDRSQTEFWAVTGDYKRNLLFYTDYRSEYVGIRYLKENLTQRHYQGMAHGIESMAFDWVTNNLYWTDSDFKWIMVSEERFLYYSPVYITKNSDPPYGLAIHSKQRRMFFSTYKALGTKIITTDLAGHGEKVLFQFPDVFDVTGLTIDYTDDRLYWTDFTGYGALVVSSALNGTDKIQFQYRSGSIFWGVAAYLDYLYVTDVHARYSESANKYYSVWVIIKHTKQTYRYSLSGKPRGIYVLSANEERSFDQVDSRGECNLPGMAVCTQICLPRINATRECKCSRGYELINGYDCVAKPLNNDFLLAADSGQGKIFQFSLTDQSEPYKVLTIGNSLRTNITTVAVDMVSSYVLWSDRKFKSIKRASVDSSRQKSLAQNNHASSMIVHPHTGNIYFCDSNYESIFVMNSDGKYVRTIIETSSDQANVTDIQMLTIDPINNHLYWTDTRNEEGKGQVWRSHLDGSKKVLVFDKLQQPRGITVDSTGKKLYISERSTGMVYEVNLETFKLSDSTSINRPDIKQYDIAGSASRLSYSLLDIAVHKEMIYFVDSKHNSIEFFNTSTGVASLKEFSPSEFYKITSLSIYSKDTFDQHIDKLPKPCQKRTLACTQICVPISAEESKCLCSDGYKPFLNHACRLDVSAINRPPSYETCPVDQVLQLSKCGTSVQAQWEEPTWSDDKTEALKITGPLSPTSTLTEGIHRVSYKAVDDGGLFAICTFFITVHGVDCGSLELDTTQFVTNAEGASKLYCNSKYGSVVAISCKDSSMRPSFKGGNIPKNKTLYNTCQQNGKWLYGKEDILCKKVLPITATKATTTKSTSTIKNNQIKTSAAGGLGTKGLIAIIVLVVILVIVIAAVVVVKLRNRPAWKVSRFPVFWNRKSEETDSTPQTTTSENPYSMMT